MIFSQAKLIAAGAGVLLVAAAFTWTYFSGKEAAHEECLKEQAKIMQLWQEKVDQAEERNQELAKDLAESLSKLEKAQSRRVERIIEYVENNPDSNTVVFDADGLSILNDAQKGITSSNQ